MASVTYKCPSCGAYLNFDPETQKWKCPFCAEVFDEKSLLDKAEEYQRQAEEEQKENPEAQQVTYHCPSCGSEIMTDETTVATNCYYCHNPVVLQGKLTSDMKPDCVLPFTVGKEKAVEGFMAWVKKKKFVPKGFFSRAEVETMNGVYYPHFVADCDVFGSFDGEGRDISVMDTPKYVVTETRHYHVRREGDLKFHNILRPALTKVNRKLSDGIHPYPLDTVKPFSGAFLTGFLAERRDIEAESITEDVTDEIKRYVEPLLTQDLHHDSLSGKTSMRLTDIRTQYMLLPSWVLTYPNKKDPKDPYYYAMNGCTGEVCGKLPIDKNKLWTVSGIIAASVFIAGCILCYLLL